MPNFYIPVYIDAGATVTVPTPGNFITLTQAAKAVRVTVDRQPSMMRIGDEQRFNKPFDRFEVENLDPNNATALEFSVGMGDFKSRAVYGKLTVSPELIYSDGSTAADTRSPLSLFINPARNTAPKNYQAWDAVKVSNYGPVAFASACLNRQGDIVAAGNWSPIGNNKKVEVYDQSWNLQASYTLESAAWGIWYLGGWQGYEYATADYASGGSVTLRFLDSAFQEIGSLPAQAAPQNSMPMLAFDPNVGMIWNSEQLIYSGGAGWQAYAGMPNYGKTQAVLFASDYRSYYVANPITGEMIEYSWPENKNLGKTGYIPASEGNLPTIQGEVFVGPGIGAEDWTVFTAKAYTSAMQGQGEVVGSPNCHIGLLTPDLSAYTSANVTTQAVGFRTRVMGEIIKACLDMVIPGGAPSDYLDHVFGVNFSGGAFGRDTYTLDSGLQSFQAAGLSDYFVAEFPQVVTLTIDQSLVALT